MVYTGKSYNESYYVGDRSEGYMGVTALESQR